MTDQSSRAERLAEIRSFHEGCSAEHCNELWLLSELEAADAETAALIRDIESYVSISSEQAGIITRLRSALQEAKEALRPFAKLSKNIPDQAETNGIVVWNVEDPDYDIELGTVDNSDLRRAAEVAAKLEKL